MYLFVAKLPSWHFSGSTDLEKRASDEHDEGHHLVDLAFSGLVTIARRHSSQTQFELVAAGWDCDRSFAALSGDCSFAMAMSGLPGFGGSSALFSDVCPESCFAC